MLFEEDIPRNIQSALNNYNMQNQTKLEQLERLRSEDNPTSAAPLLPTPAAPWLPILLNHIGSKVKTWKSQSCKFKEFAKS